MASQREYPYRVMVTGHGETLSCHTTFRAAERAARKLANECGQRLTVAVQWGKPERSLVVEPAR